MTWKFTKSNNGIKISIKNSETKSKYPLGVLYDNLWAALIHMSDYFKDSETVDLKGITETISYKSPKGYTLKKQWNHTAVIFGQSGLHNN